MIEQNVNFEQTTKIKIIGVGTSGNNVIDHMIENKFEGADFIAINGDDSFLEKSKAPMKISIMEKPFGMGNPSPKYFAKTAMEKREEITQVFYGADMVFIITGMGGACGTGAAPVVAEIAKDLGIFTASFVSKPFYFEGKKRMSRAQEGILELAKFTETLFVLPLDMRLLRLNRESVSQAFEMADASLCEFVKSLISIFNLKISKF